MPVDGAALPVRYVAVRVGYDMRLLRLDGYHLLLQYNAEH
jgi:hypothetical protein